MLLISTSSRVFRRLQQWRLRKLSPARSQPGSVPAVDEIWPEIYFLRMSSVVGFSSSPFSLPTRMFCMRRMRMCCVRDGIDILGRRQFSLFCLLYPSAGFVFLLLRRWSYCFQPSRPLVHSSEMVCRSDVVLCRVSVEKGSTRQRLS